MIMMPSTHGKMLVARKMFNTVRKTKAARCVDYISLEICFVLFDWIASGKHIGNKRWT